MTHISPGEINSLICNRESVLEKLSTYLGLIYVAPDATTSVCIRMFIWKETEYIITKPVYLKHPPYFLPRI
jgi:hypothetical protein